MSAHEQDTTGDLAITIMCLGPAILMFFYVVGYAIWAAAQ